MRRFLIRFLTVFRPRQADRELAREVAAHLRLLEDEFGRRGLTPADARLAARRAFGGVEQTKERHRDARALTWISDAGRDVRHGARVLGRNPLFTLTAVLSLAIAIGASTTTFTVADALLFHPPPGVAEPHRLVDIGSSRHGAGFGPSSSLNYEGIRARARTFAGLYAYSRFPQAVSVDRAGDGEADNIYATIVTTNYFAVLGAVPAAGRLFSAEDADAPVIVLGDGFWSRRFHRDPAVVGTSLTINGQAFRIVGVASERFRGTGIRAGDVWLPLDAWSRASANGRSLADRAAAWLLIGGRLEPGVALPQAAAELDVIGRSLERDNPADNRDTGFRALPLSPVPGNGGPLIGFLALLSAIVSIVLVVACANVAGVLLARATARRQEIAVRLTLGAGRARLVRQLLAETLLLFTIGGAAGLTLAGAMVSLLVSSLPLLPFPVDVSLALDGRAIAFSTGLALVAALLSGLAPACVGTKADVASALKDSHVAGRLRLRHAFIVAQVALSLLLVVLAGLCGRALERAASADPGFDPRGVELASLSLSQAGDPAATGPRFVRELVDRVRRLPDVRSATIASAPPGGFETTRHVVTIPAADPSIAPRLFSVDWNVVEPDYFSTLRIPLTKGRDFMAADRDGAPLVAIVGEGVARQLWPGQDAVGRYLSQPVFGPGGSTRETRTLLVVGVARDIQFTTLIDGLTHPIVYVPLQQQYTPSLTIVARMTGGRRLDRDLRTVVASMNRKLSIVAAQTLDDSIALGLMPQRIVASVAGGLGVVGLLLAAIGIYGVTAFIVARRTREIGIRIALGAHGGRVIRMVLWQGMKPVAVGAAIGLMLAGGAGRLLASYLYGIPPVDPLTFSAVALLVGSIGLAACYAPARHATRINALEALRSE